MLYGKGSTEAGFCGDGYGGGAIEADDCESASSEKAADILCVAVERLGIAAAKAKKLAAAQAKDNMNEMIFAIIKLLKLD